MKEVVGLQKRIYDAIVRSKNSGISTVDLVSIVYADHVDGGPLHAESCIKHSIFEINKKLKEDGLIIRAKLGRASSGYKLVPALQVRSPSIVPGWSEGLVA
jgi:hypothetical protein